MIREGRCLHFYFGICCHTIVSRFWLCGFVKAGVEGKNGLQYQNAMLVHTNRN